MMPVLFWSAILGFRTELVQSLLFQTHFLFSNFFSLSSSLNIWWHWNPVERQLWICIHRVMWNWTVNISILPSLKSSLAPFILSVTFLSHLLCFRGRFSVVRKCLSKASKKEVAVKCVNKKMQKKEQVAHEADILRHVQHPQLVALIDTYESPTAYMLVLELWVNPFGKLFHWHNSYGTRQIT